MIFSASVMWLIVAVLLGIAELMASTFYLLVLAGAAVVASGCAFMGMSFEWQIGVFAVLAIVGSVWVRRIRLIPTKSDAAAHALQNMDVGQTVDVSQWNDNGRAVVQYRGAQWEVRATEGTERVPGSFVIERVEGSVLFVRQAL